MIYQNERIQALHADCPACRPSHEPDKVHGDMGRHPGDVRLYDAGVVRVIQAGLAREGQAHEHCPVCGTPADRWAVLVGAAWPQQAYCRGHVPAEK